MKLATIRNMLILAAFVFFVKSEDSELTPDAIKSQLRIYSSNVNSSIRLSKSDRLLLQTWDQKFKIKMVNATTKMRVQMAKHKDQNFKRAGFDKVWTQCMDIYSTEKSAFEQKYYENESTCLRTVTSEENEKRQAVEQVEREIKRWRKSYRYLSHLCNINNPGDEDSAGTCLVEYIEKDDYNSTLQRLIVIKLKIMEDLYLQLTTSMKQLEVCLNNNLSLYLETTRNIMEKFNRCYNSKKKNL